MRSSREAPTSDSSPKRLVLHVVEAFGGGVQSAIEGWLDSAPDYHHVVVAAHRKGHESSLVPPSQGVVLSLPDGHLRRFMEIRRALRRWKPDIIHAHSSLGGVYVRLAPFPLNAPVAYSPHCFAFERTDVSRGARFAYWLAEAVMSFRTDSFLVVSAHEGRLASRFPSSPKSHLVPVMPQLPEGFCPQRQGPGRAMVIIGVGRLAPQKDPEFFARVARYCLARSSRMRFVWLGDGPSDVVRVMTEAGVSVLGWRSRNETLNQIAEADIFLHTAAWEGSPVAVEEAMSLGLPIAARNIPVLRDRGLTHLGDNPAQVANHILSLVSSEETWETARRESLTISSTYRQANSNAIQQGYEEMGVRRAGGR